MTTDQRQIVSMVAGPAARRNRWASLLTSMLVLAPILVLTSGNAAAQTRANDDQSTQAGTQGVPVTGVRLTVPRVILGAPGGEASLAIHLGDLSGLPPRSYLRIRGLPDTVTLSEGHQVTPGSWSVPLAGAADLRLMFASGSNGKNDVSVALVSIDHGVIAETKTMVVVAAAAVAGVPERRAEAMVTVPQAAAPAPTQQAHISPPVESPSRPVSPDASAPPRMLLPPSTLRQPPAVEKAPAAIAALPPPATASTPRPSLSAPDRQQAEAHLWRGFAKLREGDVASARLFFRRAADAGLGEAAVAMGHTYDAAELNRLKIVSIAPDPKEARRWYEKAVELGARAEAGPLLDRLGR